MSGEDGSARQQAAEADIASFREHLGPFVVAAETTRMPMVFTNAQAPGNPIIFVNQSFLALTGYDEHEVLGQGFDFLMERGIEPETLTELRTAFEGGRGLETQVCCRRKDGSAFWVTVFISPVRNEAGAVVQHFASFADISGLKEKEDRLRFLLDELNHRTQNTLATVLSIARQTLHGPLDGTAAEVFQERILALSKVHGLLGRMSWREVSLREVIEQALQPFGLDGREAARFSVKGNAVRLHPRTALTLALVFHELATNAMRHGALSAGAAGRIDISWQPEPKRPGGWLRLRWQERQGPPVTPPGRKGFGSRLIEGDLAQELGGEVHLDYAPAGLVCELVMPVPRGNEAGEPAIAPRMNGV